jgi:hypothetical protein
VQSRDRRLRTTARSRTQQGFKYRFSTAAIKRKPQSNHPVRTISNIDIDLFEKARYFLPAIRQNRVRLELDHPSPIVEPIPDFDSLPLED